MANVLITFPIFSNYLKKIKEKHNVEILNYSKPLGEEFFIKRIKKYDGIIILLSHKITKNVIDEGRNLKIISNYAVGYDNIDYEYALKKGIYVTNTPDVLTEATANLTWALILTVTRRIVEGDKFTREGRFKGWKPDLFLGIDLEGKTLGILGLGRIGMAVAKKASSFGMKVIYYDIKKRGRNFNYFELEKVLKLSDILSIHLPLTKDTYHLLNKERFNLIKKGAYIINTSRGEIIDENFLIKALEEKRIAGAGLDVYEGEPNINKKLFKFKNVVLTPHIGSATVETRTKMADLAIINVLNVLEGKEPLTKIIP
jgi:glyoxylate reductase